MKTRLVFLLFFALPVMSFCQDLPAEKAHFERLKIQLEAIQRHDQNLRRKLDQAQNGCGAHSPQVTALWSEIDKADSLNLLQVRAILDKWGWLGADEIGDAGNTTLFLVIQHADVATQEQYLPLMRSAVKSGKAQAQDLALLEDRILIANGKPQLYGTQLSGDPQTGEKYLSPLADPDNVDARRATMDLEPLADYLKKFDLEWDLAAYKKALPKLREKQWERAK